MDRGPYFRTAVVLGFALALVNATASAADCRYTVTSPRSNELWYRGTTYTIAWDIIGVCADSVQLHLIRNGVEVSTIDSNRANTGSMSWRVPTTIGAASNYVIRIRDRGSDTDISTESSEFTISDTSACTYRISKPSRGEYVYKGEAYDVEWVRTGSCGPQIKLDLYRGGGYVQTLVTEATNTGSWQWDVPSDLATATTYSLKIIDSGDSSIFDFSDAFSGVEPPPCTVQITSPTVADTWYTGSTHDILWSTGGSCGSTMEIHLIRSGEEVLTIDANADNTGTASWTVPTDLSSADDYSIRVRDSGDSSSSDVSEDFSILHDTASLYIYWLDIASHQAGSAGSQWRTDATLYNRGEDEADVQLWLFSSDGAQVLSSVIPGRSEGVFEDVVGVMGYEGKGCLGVASTQPLQLSGRIYNEEADRSTFGQYVHGYEHGAGLSAGASGRLLQLRQKSGEFRTNLTVTNTGDADAAVRVILFDAPGNELKRYTIDVGPRALVQDIEPFDRRAAQPDLGWGFAEVNVMEGEGLLISASVVDSRTNDGTTVPVMPELP